MINILYLSSSSSMGGAEISLYQLVKGLDRNRYMPFVLCPEPGPLVDKLMAEQIPTQVISLPAWRKLKSLLAKSIALRNLTGFIKTNNIHLIHSNSIWVNPYAYRAGKKLKIPVICHLRDVVSKKHISKYSLEKIALIIAVSNFIRKTVEEGNCQKVKIIYNGIDTSMYSQGKEILRREFPFNGYLVGIVSQLNPGSYHKGHREFILAVAEVLQQRSDVYFVIVGGDSSSASLPGHLSYIQELKNLVQNLGISDHVIFTGFRSDIPDVMASLDILVSASWTEAFGRTIIEAMAAGKPVVATAVGGVPEIVQDNITGLLIAPKDPKAIANAILHILRNDDMRLRMGNAGKNRVKELFSLEQNIEQTQAVYESLRILDPLH